jgi:mono/diheme cytochrome c family protein
MLRIFTAWSIVALLGMAVMAGCGEKKEAEAAAEEPGGRPDVAVPVAEAAGAEAEPPSGEALVQARCTSCHNLDRVREEKATPDEWVEIVDEMVEKGARLDDAERGAVVDYLAETYGK